ncbi:MAG: ATP-dependent metallopeptidase FtsH/Yme1/Tma family protein, partial [Stenotrophomonas sp.]
MNDLTKNLLLWVVVAVVLMVVFQSFSPKSSGANAQGATYSQFLDQVDSGNVQKVTFSGDLRGGTNQISYTTRGGQSATITAPLDRDLINVLRGKNVEIVQEEPSSGISLGAILMNFLPVILIIGFWLFIMRQMQGGGGGAKGAMSFGKSRAKLQGEDQIKVTFADVAGCDEAKEEVGELVD